MLAENAHFRTRASPRPTRYALMGPLCRFFVFVYIYNVYSCVVVVVGGGGVFF